MVNLNSVSQINYQMWGYLENAIKLKPPTFLRLQLASTEDPGARSLAASDRWDSKKGYTTSDGRHVRNSWL